MSECTCFLLPPEMWTTHYGAVEPGSTHEPNPNCREHFRKPPTRLANGDWSDGVDRKNLIRSLRFNEVNPPRVSVSKVGVSRTWEAYRIAPYLSKQFPTHAEAIAYADKRARMARTNQGENNE